MDTLEYSGYMIEFVQIHNRLNTDGYLGCECVTINNSDKAWPGHQGDIHTTVPCLRTDTRQP
jgi:hypothetical protein